MSDLTLLFSSVAIILSIASVVFVIIKIGLGLGLEFVERPEIRAMKKEIEDNLNKEWISNIEDFLGGYSKKIEPAKQEIVREEIVGLGEKTRHAQIASTLLKVLSKIGFDIVKLVCGIIATSIITVGTIWAILSYSLPLNTTLGVVICEVFFVMFFGLLTRKSVRDYMFVRSSFYELSEKSTLEKAGSIMNELEKRAIIYA
ncbi:MAG: hypothetical protein PVH73_01630 [Candidatus Bathyarchaeota archaeon]